MAITLGLNAGTLHRIPGRGTGPRVGRRGYRQGMATWDDVRRVALALPEAAERSSKTGILDWQVRGRTFAWERPLRRADRAALGDAAPDGPVLATGVEDVGVKEALIAEDPAVYFTTPHFDGYPAILVRLDVIAAAELDDLLAEAWLVKAPKRLAKSYLEARSAASDVSGRNTSSAPRNNATNRGGR